MFSILLPDEIIRHILEYNADFHPNLLKCHQEMIIKKPVYYKKVIGEFKHSTFFILNRNNNNKNDEISIYTHQGLVCKLNLYAIEITPEISSNSNRFVRDIHLYYGWSRKINKNMWDIIINNINEFNPGYYGN
tara:strand:- start:382 stop:780 length:399 start_codon:yes stop_codon:yes gene_type:complete